MRTNVRHGATRALAWALATTLCLAGCGSSQPAAPASEQGGEAEAPAVTAEIEDATTVAFLGPQGTYTEEATRLFFGDNDKLLAQETVADALALVESGDAAYAVVPQENTLGGAVIDYVDALLDTQGLSVVGEVVLPIRQTLMGVDGADIEHITRVYSHKQGLTQSAAWLDEHLPGAERIEAASTAAAAQEVAEKGDPTSAAIAAPGAAELYGLEVLQENVSLTDANKTRFYVVSQRANEQAGYEMCVFVADIEADELPGVLSEACSGGTELVCVHDRPAGTALGTYRYVIELTREGGIDDVELERLQGIEGLTYLGRYGRIEG